MTVRAYLLVNHRARPGARMEIILACRERGWTPVWYGETDPAVRTALGRLAGDLEPGDVVVVVDRAQFAPEPAVAASVARAIELAGGSVHVVSAARPAAQPVRG